MSEWQPIETAPRDGTPLLLYCPGMNSWHRVDGMPDMVVGLWDQAGWVSDLGDVDQGYESTGAYFERTILSPTHWMPLPEPPTPRKIGKVHDAMLDVAKRRKAG